MTVKLYARVGEQGLLEDFLIEKNYLFFEPKEVEVAEDFNEFHITTTTVLKEIDLAKDQGRIIVRRKPIEPSVN